MDIRPIRSEADYDWALKEIAPYFDNPPDRETPEGERFDVLAVLIESYENDHHAIEPAPPLEVVRFYMEQNGLTQTDLARVLGSRSRASEFLSGQRDLSMGAIAAIKDAWGISADLLMPQHMAA